MQRRIAARVLTGPWAFLLAGLLDVAGFLITGLRARVRRRRSRTDHVS